MSQQASSTSAFPSQINDNPQKTLRYLGCQPILDSRHKTLGHELLFRGGEGNCFTGDPESASRQVIDRTLTMGLSGIVGNGKIFVNCTKEILTNGLVTLLPPERTVMEVLETVEVDSSLVAACSGLKDKGYQIALDDYMPESGMDRLLDLADYVKLDFRLCDRAMLDTIRRHVDGRGIALLAEKVETEAEFFQAWQDGFEYFQGYYFARPTVLESRQIAPSQAISLQLLSLLTQPIYDRVLVEQLLISEPSLCFRLLRLVNSSGMGIRNPIRTIRQAMVMVGQHELVKLLLVASSALLSADAKAASELILLALRRAKFCESIAAATGHEPGEQYLIGMMSVMDAMLKIPMGQVLELLPLRHEAAAVLEGERNDSSYALETVRAYERQDWTACEELLAHMRMTEARVIATYAAAERWGSDQFRKMGLM